MNSRNLGASGHAPSLAYRFVECVRWKERFVLYLSEPCIDLVPSGIFCYLMITTLCLGTSFPVQACSAATLRWTYLDTKRSEIVLNVFVTLGEQPTVI